MNRIQTFLAAALFLLPQAAFNPAVAAAPAAHLTIRIEGVLAQGGLVRLGVYDRAAYDKDGQPVAFADVAARAGETVISLNGIAPGDYAIETYQDVNGNDRMDQSWIGLPLEPFGFSRDTKPFLSKPGFDDVKITLTAGDNSETVHLQNEKKTP